MILKVRNRKRNIDEIQGILDFISDENADHDGYTKPQK